MTQHEFSVLQLQENTRHNRALEEIEEAKNRINLRQLEFNVMNEQMKRDNERRQTRNTFNLGLLNAEETERSNRQREKETSRSNKAREFETARNNAANEIIAIGDRAMQREHYLNMDTISAFDAQERYRHNVMNEMLQAQGISSSYATSMANIANQKYLGELSSQTAISTANINASSHIAAANISAAASRYNALVQSETSKYVSDNALAGTKYGVDHMDTRHEDDVKLKEQQLELDTQKALLDKNKFLVQNSEDVQWYQRTLTDPWANWFQDYNAYVKHNPAVRALDELIGSINIFGGK